MIRDQEKIDYRDVQTIVINQISMAVHAATDEECMTACKQQYDAIKDKKHTAMKKLIDLFGTRGEEQAATIVYEYALNNGFTPHT